MHTVNMLQAKSSLSKLVADIESGRKNEIIIARNGQPVARLVPLDWGADTARRLGVAKGLFAVPDSIDEANEEILKLFIGEQAR